MDPAEAEPRAVEAGRNALIQTVADLTGVTVDHYAEVCKAKPWPRGFDFVPHDAKVREWGAPGARSLTLRAWRSS
jgi:hypothetical protein